MLERSLLLAVLYVAGLTAVPAESMVCLEGSARDRNLLGGDSSDWMIDCSILKTFSDLESDDLIVLSGSEVTGVLAATKEGRPLFKVDLFFRDSADDIRSRLNKAGISLQDAIELVERRKSGEGCPEFVAAGGEVELRLAVPSVRPTPGTTDEQILAGGFLELATIRLDGCEAP